MTCIVALKHDGVLYLGSDSQVSFGGTIFYDSEPKVFKKGSMIIGCAGNLVFGKILKYNFNIPDHSESLSDLEYLNSVFVDSLREICRKREYLKVIDSRSGTSDSTLICYHGEIYRLSSDFDVTLFSGDFISIGSGGEFALGSMYSTSGVSPIDRLNTAIEAACLYDDGCGGDIKTLRLTGDKK